MDIDLAVPETIAQAGSRDGAVRDPFWILDRINQRAHEIASIGLKAREEAFAAGVAIYYMQEEFGGDIVREYPDGRRERLVAGLKGPVVPLPRRHKTV